MNTTEYKEMETLQIIEKLTNNLFGQYGNPLKLYKKTQNDVRMTYYVGKLMEELGHKWISPKLIKGEKEDRAYYSEPALHDAFLAGRLLERESKKELRKEILEEIKHELKYAIDNLE